MQHAVAAQQAGITHADLNSLLEGVAYATVQHRLSVPMGHIDKYIRKNEASEDLAVCLGFHIAATQELGEHLGPKGRIGLILGLLIGKAK